MSSKSNPDAARGFGEIIGLLLLLAAALLFVAQISFDGRDLAFLHYPPNPTIHNWIGPFGSHLAWAAFFVFGLAAYVIPFVLAVFGVGHVSHFLTGYRERRLWFSTWAVLFVFSLAGLLDRLDSPLRDFTQTIGTPNAGGWLGMTTWKYGFWNFGVIGATVIYATLILISLLFLTNFRLSQWLQVFFPKKDELEADGKGTDEAALARRARELEKQSKKLQEQMDKAGLPAAVAAAAAAAPSGLGADMRPVPEPTVRDLSVPQAKSAADSARAKKTTSSDSKDTAAPTEAEAARKPGPAATADILGQNNKLTPGSTSPAPAEAAAKPEDPKSAEKVAETSEPPVEAVAAQPVTVPAHKPRLLPRRPKPITVAQTPMIGNYKLPSMDFLQHPDTTLKPTESKEELMANARLMQQTLAQFDIEVALGDITKGPTITRYEMHPAPGVKLERIAALSNNIAAVLKAERINILAPVPGKSSVGIEVPNLVKTKVIMRDLLESEEWRNTKARIPLALGKDVYGQPIIADLGDMPHLLIAGSTGSGKSVCINSIIASLLYRFSPDQLRFVMIDPKVVELQQYNALPHLVVPVVNDPKKVILALRWVVNEMEKRYQIFARVGVRNIKSFNERPKNKLAPPREPELPLMAKKEKVEPGAEGFAVEVDDQIVVPREADIVIPEKLSYIVVIIDELADLMLVAPADVEMAIARITQMARAAGIHCIVATQRPSVDVITGVIKSNIPARIAFQVAAAVDSRTILDAKGADKLLGKGDMLYLPPGSAKLIRAQGALITDQEIQSAVDFIAAQGKPSYEAEIQKQLSKPSSSLSDESGIDEDEEIIEQCIEVIRSEQKASVSLLQRRLRLGYGRAARIMDELENRGIVGPSNGAEPRDILIDLDGEGHDGGEPPVEKS
jgi:S-DNA-T family DNA segregation ATPase FtsK/SpoIIIE